MRDPPLFGEGEFGGADVHSSVKLHGVGVDALTSQPERDVHGEVGLSGRGGTHDGDDWLLAHTGKCVKSRGRG
ncbi:hypothetical protein GCM10012289_19310 [Nonomuraea cavernae]|uniref:Uncharacterized protein n=1 Tax=Nonomuraea cavernae TaxID=2045107 RepID=A0A918DGS0_9ACTN|nr:hypothetical protein GCM10012289_19310 [Nonomuraea cavernae]